MEIDLHKMSKDELEKLIKDAQKALKDVEVRRRAEAKKALEEAAKEHGFSLGELLDGQAVSKKGSKNPAKYRNPSNPSQTWTGKGRKPNWVKEGLEAGKALDEFRI